MPSRAQKQLRGDTTRAALVAAALKLFGDRGFEGTTTREIAAAAGVNIAMIAYHFGGKEGLRSACADHVAQQLSQIFAAGAARRMETAREASAALAAFVGAFVRGVVANEAARPLARFLMREIADPSPAFARVFETAFEPLHRQACAIWARATGAEAESEDTRLSVFTIIAQVVYFRIARAPVLMRMGWRDIGPDEAQAIESVILANLDAALDAARSRAP